MNKIINQKLKSHRSNVFPSVRFCFYQFRKVKKKRRRKLRLVSFHLECGGFFLCFVHKMMRIIVTLFFLLLFPFFLLLPVSFLFIQSGIIFWLVSVRILSPILSVCSHDKDGRPRSIRAGRHYTRLVDRRRQPFEHSFQGRKLLSNPPVELIIEIDKGTRLHLGHDIGQ